MKVNSVSYPLPVLGNGDDLGGHFKVELRYDLSRETIILNPVFTIKNSGLEELLRKNKASYIIEVECRNTFFRKSFSTRKHTESFSIPAQSLRERVTVSFYFCADQEIRGYRPTEPHPDYDGSTFDIEAGDVLAIGGQASFIADKSFDPLRPPVSSFMSIMEGSHFEGPIQVNYEAEKITVILSKDDWKNYLLVRGQKPIQDILHNAIVFPALVDAIHQTQDSSGDFQNMNWYERLLTILETKGLTDKPPFEAAQIILNNPSSRGFKGMNALISEADEENYE